MALEYSYDGRLEVGIGRTSVERMTDGFLKYRLVRQRPYRWQQVRATLLSSLYYTILHDPDQARPLIVINPPTGAAGCRDSVGL